MRLRLLDLDGSLMEQEPFRQAVAEGWAQSVDLRRDGPALRLWANASQRAALRHRLAELPPAVGDGIPVTFLGSGDFHHLSALMIIDAVEAVNLPITVIHFDNHPDWDRLPPAWHCGSWINRLLDCPLIERIVTLGPCARDLDIPQWKTGNVAALNSGRLELHPWRRPPSRVWGKIGSGFGHHRDGRHLIWHNLADLDWSRFLVDLIERLPTAAVWITIDKDVLRPEEATTNWDQGEMPLDALIEALHRLCAGKNVLGTDVCGEYSAPCFNAKLKSLAARFFQPVTRPDLDLTRNARTNVRLLETLVDCSLFHRNPP
ncbi:MAG: arginase [Methylovirgula sp.]